MKNLMGLAFIALTPLASQAKDSEFGMSFKVNSYEISGVENDLNVFGVGYDKFLTKYFSVGAFVGTGFKDNITQSLSDNYIASINDTTPLIDIYESTYSIDSEYSVKMTGYVPLNYHWSIYTSVGYQVTNWSSLDYVPFVDTLPSSAPQESLDNGAGFCEIFGQELRCGNDLSPISSEGDVSGLFIEGGLKWHLSTRTSAHAGYRTLASDEDSVESFLLGISLKF
jgi:hypothetical protein